MTHRSPEVDEQSTRPKTALEHLRSPMLWLGPIVVVTGLMASLAAMYVGAVTNPTKNLHDFPIAVVNEDIGGSVKVGDRTQTGKFGQQVIDGLLERSPKGMFDLRPMSADEATVQVNSAKVYGVVIIPRDFSQRALELGRSAVTGEPVAKPQLQVWTDARSGTFASAIVTQFGNTAGEMISAEFGKQLEPRIRDQMQEAGLRITGATITTLRDPIDLRITPVAGLPENSGNGLTAFYFTLLLILAGFTGSLVVHSLVDGRLGFIPFEVGPIYRWQPPPAMSRLGALVIKWFLMFIIAMVVSAMYLLVCHWVGMSVPNMFQLWMFSVLAITACGVTATSIMAVFGTPGMLVNLLLFVILGLPSSGGTLPLEASPRIYEWLASFIPMHQLYIGVRAILYFDGQFAAGLSKAVVMSAVGLAVGLLLGLIGTVVYDRIGLLRSASALGVVQPQ